MTITQQDVDALYKVYRLADEAFGAICAEAVDKNDRDAVAAHMRRFEEARHFRRDTQYAWERARDLSLQPST